MKRTFLALALAALALPALAADKSYQVTGPVVEVSPDSITVQKGKENWQIARNAGTTATAEPKKGDKVTVYYSMTATKIEVKGGGEKKAKGKK